LLIRLAFAYEQATKHRVPPPSTPPLNDSLAEKFIGSWKLVEVLERDSATGEERKSARAIRNGQLLYTANGRLSVQIVRADRDKAEPGSSVGFSSYFGSWKLLPEEGCVVHFQEGNLVESMVGQAAKR
jgi:hypothetical protein